ncbi:MAG: DNA translocase FtsK [Pseudomonadota bacterium]
MPHDTAPSDLLLQATELVVRLNAVSVSLLQRHFQLAYTDGLALAAALERTGIVTAAGIDGYRGLTPHAHALHAAGRAPSARELFESWAIDPFEGGDGGDAGSAQAPSIWVYGIEHGDAANLVQQAPAARDERDYSIDLQLRYPFNVAAFKLFSAMHGEPIEHYEQFARRQQPWVPGTSGYLKGNLYPYPCRTVSDWSEQAQRETGFTRKEDMLAWCKAHRLPAIAEAVRRHKPRLFIGIGADCSREFSLAFFGAEVPLQVFQFAVNGFTKKIRYATHNESRLVVLPHVSGRPNGLNSHEALLTAGSFIAGLMR